MVRTIPLPDWSAADVLRMGREGEQEELEALLGRLNVTADELNREAKANKERMKVVLEELRDIRRRTHGAEAEDEEEEEDGDRQISMDEAMSTGHTTAITVFDQGEEVLFD